MLSCTHQSLCDERTLRMAFDFIGRNPTLIEELLNNGVIFCELNDFRITNEVGT